MRIVGGKYKGRTLVAFEGKDIRPTSDMARESLFNILRDKILSSSFLDLFAGSGAIGIEAISRGAERVVFNDLDIESIRVIKKNLEKIGVTPEVIKSDALKLLETLKAKHEKFDIVFIDPPYKSGLGEKAVKVSAEIIDDGVIIWESETEFSGVIEGLTVTDKRRYGKAHLTFFSKEK